MRGIQRGVGSFTGSTALAAIDLIGQVVYAIQSTAQFAHDIVTPSSGHHHYAHYTQRAITSGHHGHVRLGHYNYVTSITHGLVAQPRDFREGVNAAYVVMKEGFGGTARTVAAAAASAEDTPRMIGAVVRTAPAVVVDPFIHIPQAAGSVLIGLRNQIAPTARKEDQDKWK